MTLYGLLFKYNYVGCLLLLMFSSDLLFAIKRDAYIFKETGWFCRCPRHQKLDKWTIAGEKRQTCWPKLHIETEYESQVKQKYKEILVARKKEMSDRYMAYARDVCRWTETQWVQVEMEKRKTGKKKGDWGFDEVVCFLFARTLFSGLYRWRTSIRTSFWYKCRSDRVEYAQNFNMLLGRLGKPATYHFSE